MASSLDAFAEKDFKEQFDLLRFKLSSGASYVENPRAYLLGGQSGAGKTRLQ